MYDIKPLEEKWEKYNRKQKRPLYILLFILFILIGSAIFIKYKGIDVLTIFNNYINKVEVIKNEISYVDINKTKVKNQSLIEVSERGTIDNISNPIEDIDTIKKPKVHLNIIETSSEEAYDDVSKRFMLTHNIDDSLFLAKSYYNKKDYKKAIYWAFETNKIDADIDESWFILVNSKVKLGHKNEAIGILTKYIKRTNSAEANNLLYKIKKGTL
ncbi:MAG: CDC27 family protein [Campylobacterota bacterium]|nr:CDC27 family protein [Campylobacterota bacterium]